MTLPKTCGHPDHMEPWYTCPHCRATSHYSFEVNGGTPKFHREVGDLPPHDEVSAQKREQGCKTIGGDD